MEKHEEREAKDEDVTISMGATRYLKDDCSICLGPKMEPVAVPCGHTFCCACINRLLLMPQSNRERRCPLCRAEITALGPRDEPVPAPRATAISPSVMELFLHP